MLDVTGHVQHCTRDYATVRALGIRVVRESVGWSRSERGGRYDFSDALRRADAARKAGLRIIWALWHYGLPDDLDLFDDALTDRFAEFADAAARALDDRSLCDPIFCPINEISFLAWAVSESPLIHPYRGSPGAASSAQGFLLKQRLVRAALAACDAIRAVIPGAQMLHIEPLIHVVARDPSAASVAAHTRGLQFQAWDMLAGRLSPELGGAPRYLDCVGVNYYHGNQFELETRRPLHWHLRDPRRMPVRALLREIYARYRRPVLVAETSHFGIGRDRWLAEMAGEVREARRDGVPVAGLCLYPITDRPDWEQPAHWHRSGLWDRCIANDGSSFERLHLPYLRAIRHAQHWLGDDTRGSRKRNDETRAAYGLIVFAADRWAGIAWPRRALIEALAVHWTVLVVEDANRGHAAPARAAPASTGVVVLTPHAPATDDDAHDDGASATVRLVLEALASANVREYGAWLLTPMALPVLPHLAPDVVAYTPDIAFRAVAPPDPRFVQRHRALMSIAGVTGAVSREILERARHAEWSPAARAMIEHSDGRTCGASSCHAPAMQAECAIIGAGLAGLCAALHYGRGSVLLERDIVPGGSRRSVVDQGFQFDFAGHVLDGADAWGDLYRRLLGDNAAWWQKSTAIAAASGPADRSVPLSLSPWRDAFDDRPERIGYPLHGGMQALIDGFLPLLGGDLLRHAKVVRILPRERCVVLDDRRRIRYQRLIATQPLPALVELCEDDAPPDIRAAARALRTVALRCVNVGVRGVPPTRHDWLIHAGDVVFDRTFMQGNVCPSANRSGGFAIACEIVHSPARPLTLNGSALVARCLDDCVRSGLIASREAVIVAHEINVAVACVIDDDPRHANLDKVGRWLDAQGIGYTGSRGEWETGRCSALLSSGRRAARDAARAIAAQRERSATQ